ncbi:uncharacterized protein LOC112527554 [Cynara cardunculus var. scolymus]|uniref:uncharacterized protein LOC112527554 n=1 Tax=Cynara cardunculus var. scolymus TaxID=59895 RepID=UPI000D62AFC9|nr:uncharacterized protein LOC112527554 [Cynara cardunculus var. scolymus]
MEITNLLCQALQRKDQDISNSLRLVASTKLLLQLMKDESWDALFCLVKSFCQVCNIDIPDLSSSYFSRGNRAHHRFSDGSMEMFRLASTLDPKNAYETFRSLDVRQLVEKFYSEDFNDHEKTILKMQLQHYAIDVVQLIDYKQLTSITELVSIATTERSFLAMNIVKTRIQNKMNDEFLNDSLLLFIEREVAEKISLEEIDEDFKVTKDRRVPL